MIQTIVILVLIAIIVLLFAAILIAHRKQSDALAILTAMSATLITWVTIFKSRNSNDSGNAGKGTQ